MVYNPDLAKEGQIPVGELIEGAIIEIRDGKTRDFVKEEGWKDWKGDLDALAIEVHAEGKYKGQQAKCTALYNYAVDPEDGAPVFSKSKRSNAKKFKDLYKHYPKIGMKIKLVADSEGYWKIYLGA